MKKRWMAAVLCLLLAGFWAPGGVAAADYVMAGYDPADVGRDWAANAFFARMEEKTGIAFEFKQYGDRQAWEEALQAYRAGQNLPDVLFKAELTPAAAMELLDAGALIDLAPLLEQNAPHLYALLESNPAYRDAVAFRDGRIAALPFIDTAPAQNCLWINKGWLDALKLSPPTTAGELKQVLTAFAQKDPNRNGRQDEVPLSFLGAYDLKYLAHAFGLAANDFNLFLQDGAARFLPAEENFPAFVRYLRELWDEGLLDRQGFVSADQLRRITDAKKTNIYGAFFAPLPTGVVPIEWADSYMALPPLVYQGRQVYRAPASPVTYGCFAITAACKDPAAMLRWVDTLYTLEGAVLASEGVEGEDYLVDGDGTWRKTDSASQTSFLSLVAVTTGGAIPGISAEAFENRYQDTRVAGMRAQIDSVARHAVQPFPTLLLSRAQEQAVAPLQSAIGRFVDEGIARFVVGEWEVSDRAFEQFRAQLDEMGIPQFLAFWQAALEK